MSVKRKSGKGMIKVEIFSRPANEDRAIRGTFPPWPAPWIPSADIYEKKDELVVEVELPGVDPRDLNVTVHANRVELKGRKREEETVKGRSYLRLEREYGEFSRFIPLPCLVIPDHSQAWLEDGVLILRLKKYSKK